MFVLHLSSAFFVAVLRQYAHLPVCLGVKHHGCQQLWVSWRTALSVLSVQALLVSIQALLHHLHYQHFPRRLAGGLPPYASVYPTWVDCWRHLSREVSHRAHTPDDFRFSIVRDVVEYRGATTFLFNLATLTLVLLLLNVFNESTQYDYRTMFMSLLIVHSFLNSFNCTKCFCLPFVSGQHEQR